MKTPGDASPPTRRPRRAVLLALLPALLAAGPLAAIEPPAGRSAVAEREFRHPDLRISAVHRAPAELPAAAAAQAHERLSALGVARAETARLDLRSGRWATLMPGTPLLPGLSPSGGPWPAAPGPPVEPAALERQAWEAFAGYLGAHRGELGIDPTELVSPGRIQAHGAGELIQIHVARAVRGVPVRDSYLTAVINRGNLVLFGARQWGDVGVSTEPAIGADGALARLQTYIGGEPIAGFWGKRELLLVPMARGREEGRIVPGEGYAFRLVWSLKPRFAGDHGSWEGLIDAHTGELVAFEDRNHYATAREVKGGVYPVSNDGTAPDGVEQGGWPMPFESLVTGIGTVVTDSGGNAPVCLDGDITADLAGPFVRMSDTCGAISLTGSGSLDFGVSGGTDCTTPGVGGAGNTHASRTGFHEVNRLREQAKGQLPGNGWLDQQLTANMNLNDECNAFWNGSTINFYRETFPATDPTPECANTGELAGVFDHEWGHGMDDNDVVPTVSSPGEGIADLYMYFRLDTSCIGRGFRLGTNCTGFGDACTSCDGVREIDWAKRASGAPHDTVWANSACFTFPPTGHPCGGVTHCEGQVYAEAVYDLVNRDLPCLGSGWDLGTGQCTGGAPPVMDHNTAFEIGTRLTYLGAGAVGSWFTCDTSPPLFGGCNADGGYLNYLAADDDNGNLADGTPHMSAIFDAFDRHGIACNTPAVTDSGCAGAPTTAPVVTVTTRDRGADLSWGAVTGATKYQVFRTDGVFACDFGKIKVGETTGLSFTDGGLQNGRDYSYVVIPIGADDSCMGPASACDTVTPAAGPNLAVDAASAALAFSTGDGDGFVDNCEQATLSFDVVNIGSGSQTNVRIDAVRAVSHGGVTIDALDPASPSGLAACATGNAGFDFTATGLAFGDTLVFEVDVTSDELSPLVVTRTLEVPNAESDLQFAASQLWDFESDLDGWSVVQGTFNQTTTGGGASGTSGYLASSANLDDRCDQVRSPAFQLRASSTLSLFNNFEIEAFSSGQWWDRANVAIAEGSARSAVAPDGGRLYNASGDGASCVTAGQDGWADTSEPWGQSTWSATALGAAGLAGRTVRLDVAYGTDAAANGKGFWLDRVLLSNVDLLVADAQTDVCNTPPTVVISAPTEGQVFDDTDPIGFTGTANDPEDLVLTPSLAWTSDLDGAIGSGGSFMTMLSVGYHTVTAEVTDSGGLAGSDVVHVVVENPPGCAADETVTGTVTGPDSRAGVNSLTVGTNALLDGTGGPVTIEAGNRIEVRNNVELRGTVTLGLSPTPCS